MSDKMKQRVTFCNIVKTRSSIQKCCNGISSDVRQACWYSNEEYESMRKQAKKSAYRLCDTFREELLWSSGLETSEMRRKRQKAMRRSRLAVLLEQEQQWDAGGGGRGESHELLLARRASDVSKCRAEAAAKRGVIIQQQVRKQQKKRQTTELQRSSSSSSSSIDTNNTTNDDTGRIINAPPMWCSEPYKPFKTERAIATGSTYYRGPPSRLCSQPASSFHKWGHLSKHTLGCTSTR
jgi:hypothetical protein